MRHGLHDPPFFFTTSLGGGNVALGRLMTYRLDRVNPLDAQQDDISTIDFDHIQSVIRRQWRVVVLAMAIAGLLGVIYAQLSTPIYTASADILIDTSSPKIADQFSAVSGISNDETSILSQVELLRSDKLAAAVSKKLDLINDTVFRAVRVSLFQKAKNGLKGIFSFGGSAEVPVVPSADDMQNDIAQSLQKALRVTRVTGTLVLNLEFSSVDPALAAKIVQGYAEAYLTYQLDSKFDATRRASEWLQSRLGDLRQKALDADQAVQRFKIDRALISSDGMLISDQRLTQINKQLVQAKTETDAAEAKYRQIKRIVDSGDMSGAVGESLSSVVVSDLMTKYLEASRRQSDIQSRLGRDHAQSQRLKNEMSEYQRLMFEELSRIAETYRSDYEIASQRQKSVEAQLAAATDVSALANDDQVQLRELTRESETNRILYETYLQRYQESVQQQSLTVTQAQIISTVKVPKSPSAPKKPLLVAISMFLGLMAGSVVGALREFGDRFFRTGDQIRAILDLEPLGSVPLVNSNTPVASPDIGTAGDRPVLQKKGRLANYVVDHPVSAFAETMRSAKIAVDLMAGVGRPKMIGVVSVLPSEGKSTISINFAELLASQGSNVLLIDSDLRNPGATRQIGSNAKRGLMEALEDSSATRDILMINPQTKLAFLPAVLRSRVPYSSELLVSPAMDKMLAEVSPGFDYIIFDLPPLAPIVDARAMAAKLDSYLFVIEWGKTSRGMVKKTLQNNVAVAEKCAGVILNKVDTKKIKLYQEYGSTEFNSLKYEVYYKD